MRRIKGMPARIALSLLTFSALPSFASTPATASPPAPALIESKAFADSIKSGQLDVESYDFDSAGFFRLTPGERMQWQVGVLIGLGMTDGSGPPPCSMTALRSRRGFAWVQIAQQSTDASEWKVTARTIRARLAEIDRLLEHSVARTQSSDPLIRELSVRFARDQNVRHIFEQKWTEGLTSAQANNWLGAAATRMEAIDCDNTAWLKSQLARIDWFIIPKYGAEADMAAWHLVQHADQNPSFQHEMLGRLQSLPSGQTDGKRLGMLVDRVLRSEGHLQKYGTQGQCKDGQWAPFESEEPQALDARRASLGMQPIAELMKFNSREACQR